MKKWFKIFGILTLVFFIGFTATTCMPVDKPVDDVIEEPVDEPEDKPEYPIEIPEVVVVPGKSVKDYFAQEGIKLGWNLGNTFDAINWANPSSSTETSWGNPTVTQALFNGVKAQGVDIVRIPCTWTGFTGPAPDYTITPARLARVKEVVDMANTAGLKVIINIHHDGVNNPYNNSREFGWLKTEFHKDDVNRGDNAIGIISDEYKEYMYDRYHKVWKQIAEYFKDYDEWLIFQSMNEVHDGSWYNFSAAEYTIMNELNQIFSNTVRATGGKNATRYLMFACLAAKPDALRNNNFKMPVDATGPGRQIVTFHTYDPYNFAHDAEADWTGTSSQKTAIDNILTPFKTRFIDNNIPVIIGEMGPRWNGNTSTTRQENRITYISYVYNKAYTLGLIPVYWDDGGNFKMIERSGANVGQPRDAHAEASFAAMREAVGKSE